MRSQFVSPSAQLLIVLVQPAKPNGSGSRPRKSRYCWRTKKLVLSIGLGPFVASLSVIVTVAIDCAPRVAPEGLLRLTRKVSVPSAYESSTMATEKVFADASPAAQVAVPIGFSYSQRGDAVP